MSRPTEPRGSRRRRARRGLSFREVVPVIGICVIGALLLVLALNLGEPSTVAADVSSELPDGPAAASSAATTATGSSSTEEATTAGTAGKKGTEGDPKKGTEKGTKKPADRRVTASAEPAQSQQELRRIRRLARSVSAGGIDPVIGPLSVRVGTFNILGSQHTGPGGDKGAGWPGWAARMPGTIERIKAHGASVVGLQEAQPDQIASLTRGTGYAIFPGSGTNSLDRVNSIIYDPGVFEFVSGSTFQMSNGIGTRAQPILLLRHRESGREIYFVNAHPPSGHSGSQTATRMGTFTRLVSEVNRLKATGHPVVLTGDMNDRAPFFCRVVAPTGMVASAGGSTSGGCRPPARMPVDWVVATSGVTFSNNWLDDSTIKRRITDHPFISATATIAGD
ncbi:hypothetical protein E8D34_09765 [Nocardioides sp. GY 10113]|uniref:endonuclease/exonuclease/phosphatase family protein n=1 Tax=Nocardioides sp. GY 10113 TaxID=2569761 RepID=UPI0010A7D05D|nr:endonuclease/exonuclease/phosphatase family protein [Nocardioides sp. GY 10113]TIC87409.1 hypothetical protein E8D34_09765 [Nocardioides sp. GY 10113]